MLDMIAFDADDTLWENMGTYREGWAAFQGIVGPWAPEDTSLARLQEVEIRNLSHFGYGIKGFTLSMIETAIEVTEGRIPASALQALVDLGRDMLAHPVQLLPGALPCLEALAPRVPLMVITKGDLFDQESKLARSGLAPFFRHMEVVSEKDEGTYRRLLARHSLAPERFLMVGNSLKSDILPVLQAGGQAVHVPHTHTWSHEEIPEGLLDPDRHLTLPSLEALPTALATRLH